MLYSIITAILSGESIGITLIVQMCAIVFIVICCFPIHESAHAWAAERLGDPTGRLSGRITLNPLAHLDIYGTLMILIFGFGYAKPVPVNIRNFPPKKRKAYFGLTAAAGPASNLLLAIFFSILSWIVLLKVFKTSSESNLLTTALIFFRYASKVNVMLAVFNLIPVPPLDGSRLLTAFLPDHIYYKIMQYERYSMIALFAVIFIMHRIGISPISILSGYVSAFIDWLTGLPFKPFL